MDLTREVFCWFRGREGDEESWKNILEVKMNVLGFLQTFIFFYKKLAFVAYVEGESGRKKFLSIKIFYVLKSKQVSVE